MDDPSNWPTFIVKGTISGHLEEQAHLPEGTIEWQMSDGPPGERGSSADYLDLAEALRKTTGPYDITHAEFTAEEQLVFDAHMMAQRA